MALQGTDGRLPSEQGELDTERIKKEKRKVREIEKYKNALKNVIMRIVIEIRERKDRPKLKDLIEVYRQRKSENRDVAVLREKFILLYQNNESNVAAVKDENFTMLLDGFNRVHKSLSQQ